MDSVCLEMRNITKRFPGVLALNKVDFDLRNGEVHVLMGENGAGKSTLMKILSGLHQPDDGQIIINNKPIEVRSPAEAMRNRISMIHQELSPIPEMTIAENIFIGREPSYLKRFGLLDAKEMHKNTEKLLKSLNLNFDPRKKMKELSVGQMQMVEVAKAISYDANIIIMDEPTSAITEREVEHLFSIIALLKEKNVGIIYISHKMEEVGKIADRISVLRDGELISTRKANEVTIEEIIKMMVGREIKTVFPKEDTEKGDIILEVKDLTKKGLFQNVSFSLRKGEVLGIAGLMGSGRTELVETIFGIRKADSGSIHIKNRKIGIDSPLHAIKAGMAIVSEDRKNVGLNLKGSVKENITLVKLKEYCNFGVIKKKEEIRVVKKSIDKFNIKTPSVNQKALFLSGGNQQKVVVAKWLLSDPEICILDEPTRGIDVGAKVEIHKLISNLAKEGRAVIMVSSELPEIIGMSDRVLVMHEGKLMGHLMRNELSQEKIMSFTLQKKESNDHESNRR